MTKRKPPGQTFTSWTEEQIREAEREGAFERLPGEGKPLPDAYKPYDPDWWIKSLVQREKISILPPALEARQKVARALTRIAEMAEESSVRQEIAALNIELARLNSGAATGPATHIGRLDVGTVLQRWQKARRGRPE